VTAVLPVAGRVMSACAWPLLAAVAPIRRKHVFRPKRGGASTGIGAWGVVAVLRALAANKDCCEPTPDSRQLEFCCPAARYAEPVDTSTSHAGFCCFARGTACFRAGHRDFRVAKRKVESQTKNNPRRCRICNLQSAHDYVKRALQFYEINAPILG